MTLNNKNDDDIDLNTIFDNKNPNDPNKLMNQAKKLKEKQNYEALIEQKNQEKHNEEREYVRQIARKALGKLETISPHTILEIFSDELASKLNSKKNKP